MGDMLNKNVFLDKVIGGRSEFSMQNRAFNFVCVVSFLILIFCIFFDAFISQWLMICVMTALLGVLAVIYYFARFKMLYKPGIVAYAICSYTALIINYKYNSGINGPTLFLFFVVFHLLIVTSPSKYYKIWIFLHIFIALGLIGYEYFNPDAVPDTYPSRYGRFLDVIASYLIGILFFFLKTRYLVDYYNGEKQLAEERAIAIEKQNEQIILQNQELERVNEEKDKMFSIVSHDLRSPIDTILGFLEVLSADILEPDEKVEIETQLRDKVKNTSELILNLLFWSKAQMNGVTVSLAPVSLMDLLDEARTFLLSNAAKKSIKITYNISRETEVVADKDMLRIILRNIIGNAIKFTNSGGEVAIKLTQKGSDAEISIKDNGIGIPVAKQGEMFSLKSGTTFGTENEKGIGLGLMLCKEFMGYQNGKIWFESEEGKGSTFYLSLPLAQL